MAQFRFVNLPCPTDRKLNATVKDDQTNLDGSHGGKNGLISIAWEYVDSTVGLR